MVIELFVALVASVMPRAMVTPLPARMAAGPGERGRAERDDAGAITEGARTGDESTGARDHGSLPRSSSTPNRCSSR